MDISGDSSVWAFCCRQKHQTLLLCTIKRSRSEVSRKRDVTHKEDMSLESLLQEKAKEWVMNKEKDESSTGSKIFWGWKK